MNKQKGLRILNPIMAVDFVCLVGTALFNDLIPYEIYEIVHPTLGYLLVVLVILHVYLNWSWIKTNLLVSHKDKSEG